METSSNQLVKVSKEFPVSVDELYQAWVSADALKQWWKPMGHQLNDVTNELRAGGKVEYRFGKNQDEALLIISGNYEEVKERERLVYSWNWQFPKNPIEDAPYKLTIQFLPQGNGSRIEVTQENLKDEEAIKVHEEGWNKALNDLDGYLSS